MLSCSKKNNRGLMVNIFERVHQGAIAGSSGAPFFSGQQKMACHSSEIVSKTANLGKSNMFQEQSLFLQIALKQECHPISCIWIEM